MPKCVKGGAAVTRSGIVTLDARGRGRRMCMRRRWVAARRKTLVAKIPPGFPSAAASAVRLVPSASPPA
jgi:hypothetical protein